MLPYFDIRTGTAEPSQINGLNALVAAIRELQTRLEAVEPKKPAEQAKGGSHGTT